MSKQWAVQTRDKEYSTRWDEYSDIFDTEREAMKGYFDRLSRNKHYAENQNKKITRLVSFTVNDPSVPIHERPANGCLIIEVLEYHEDK